MQVRSLLGAADERRARAARTWGSLGPGRTSARSLVDLGEPLLAHDRPDVALAVGEALARVSDAISEHFPENLFADLDAVAGALAHEARRAPPGGNGVADQLVALHELYGRSTTIRFRYVHDFLYGFDWARWVAAAPAEREREPPFGRAFLGYSLARGRELLALIDEGDPKYHRLAAGEARSPFPFRRDPDAEGAILRALAAEGSIPVAAWDTEPRAAWDRPYVRLREEKARSLGLMLDAPVVGAL